LSVGFQLVCWALLQLFSRVLSYFSAVCRHNQLCQQQEVVLGISHTDCSEAHCLGVLCVCAGFCLSSMLSYGTFELCQQQEVVLGNSHALCGETHRWGLLHVRAGLRLPTLAP
jgi:hypothetical protein